MYEHRSQALLPRRAFLFRVLRQVAISALLVAVALLVGVVGYHALGRLAWVDALLNAAMILGGMGPVDTLHGDAAKIFASGYALFSGVIFIAVAGLLFVPVLHRLIHHFHLELDDKEGN